MNKNNPLFIAEVKTESPFGYKSKYSYDYLLDMAIENGDWISIHSSPLFGGSYDKIYQARNRIEKIRLSRSIVAKGFHRSDSEIKRCLDEGATYVLCVDFIPHNDLIDRCLLEISNFENFKELAGRRPDLKYVHNLRDLNTGLLHKYNDFHVWREAYPDVWLCQASGIWNKQQVNPAANAYIVGENLVRFIDNN